MHRVKRWIIILAATFLSLGALYVLFSLVFTDFLVDEWWFQSLGYGFYFWQRLLYRYLVLAGFTSCSSWSCFSIFGWPRGFWARRPWVKPSQPRGSASGTGGCWSTFASGR